jgi:hypothetical protein
MRPLVPSVNVTAMSVDRYTVVITRNGEGTWVAHHPTRIAAEAAAAAIRAALSTAYNAGAHDATVSLTVFERSP